MAHWDVHSLCRAPQLLDANSTPITPSAESRPVIQPPGRNDLNGSPVTDPRIASLAAMFPDFDLTILSDVLDTCNGDQDRAIEILLGMNDPSYNSKALDTVSCPTRGIRVNS